MISEDVNCIKYIPLNSLKSDSIVSAADMPKTSEYAFFKKLKKDVGHSNSDLLHRRSKLSKNSTSGGLHFDSSY